MSTKKVKVKQVKSSIRHIKRQQDTLLSLGLGRIGKVAEHKLSPSTLGMLKTVSHLVQIEQVK